MDLRSRPGETDRRTRVSGKAVKPGDVLCLGATGMRHEGTWKERADGTKPGLEERLPWVAFLLLPLGCTLLSVKWRSLVPEDGRSERREPGTG